MTLSLVIQALTRISQAVEFPGSACPDVQIDDVQWLLVQSLAALLDPAFTGAEAEYAAYRILRGRWMTEEAAEDSYSALTLTRGESRTKRADELVLLTRRFESPSARAEFHERLVNAGLLPGAKEP